MSKPKLHIQKESSEGPFIVPVYCGKQVPIRDTISRHRASDADWRARLCPDCLRAEEQESEGENHV